MDTATLILVLGGFVGTALVVVFLVSRMMRAYTDEIYRLIKSSERAEKTVPAPVSAPTSVTEKEQAPSNQQPQKCADSKRGGTREKAP